MGKKIIIIIGIISILGIGGYFGFQKYQESENQKFNQKYQTRLTTLLSGANNLADSIDVLKQEVAIIGIPPQSEKLNPEVKEFVNNEYKRLKARKKDLEDWVIATRTDSIDGYVIYITNNPNGSFLKAAKSHISAIQREQEKRKQQEQVAIETANNYGSSASQDQFTPESEPPTASNLIFNRLICHKQQEISGTDKITLKIDGTEYLSAYPMKTGDVVDLTSIPNIPLSEKSYIPITIVEKDPFRDDGLLDLTLNGNKFEKHTYEEQGGTAWGGNYTLVYTIE